ncbi:hypothetical protein [Sphingomonas sp.]|uniref:hypothetical protein n=1 Tax=Sphingomonas sp. TaxID=28214 RepID=UPI003B0024D9
MAQVLGRELDLPVIAGESVQTNKSDTPVPPPSSGWSRQPCSMAKCSPAPYVLVDDNVGMGGTLANLRGDIEARGGSVIAITTLTESHEALALAPPGLGLMQRLQL